MVSKRHLLRVAVALCALSGITSVRAQTPAFLNSQAADEPIVTGAPYSGEGITTVKLVMFDGTRIDRSVTAKFFRDSAGRVRREQTVVGLESLDPSSDFRAVVIIVDPVARVIYTLNPGSHIAYRLSMDALRRAAAAAGGNALTPAAPAKEESLGTRDIDGLTATGRRTVITIPAGQMGNDRPIEITDERWDSVDLKVVLQSRHHDPRSGDVEYRLTKLSRAEPARDLFTVPSGYTIVDTPVAGRR